VKDSPHGGQFEQTGHYQQDADNAFYFHKQVFILYLPLSEVVDDEAETYEYQ
jgi:hypothetical protein